MKKIFTLLITLLLSFTLFSCIIVEDDIPKEEINLPNQNQTENIKANETIYISTTPTGTLNTIKATRHLRDTAFNYYETFGKFEKDGHLNISYGNAPIIIKGDKALAPSLKSTDNFFYMLNLNTNYYKEKLPFNITINYYLNDLKTNYNNLEGANGEIGIEIKITPNEETNEYFKNFGAQVQIPIDLARAQILEHKGSMAEIQTGQQTTLAYMVLPNSEQTIYIKLLGSNFKFGGIDISYQQLDFFDILSSYIDFDALDFNEYLSMFSNMDELIQSLNYFNNETKPLFEGISLLSGLTDIKMLMSLNSLLTNLNSQEFQMGLNLSKNMLKPDLENKAQIEANFDLLNETLNTIISTLTTISTALNANPSSLMEMMALINSVTKYSTHYKDFELIVENLNMIALIGSNMDSFNLDDLAENKELYTAVLKNISEKGLDVEKLFNSLIKNMYTFPLDLENFVDNLDGIVEPLTSMLTIFELLNHLKDTLNNYVDLVESLKELDGFIATEHIDMFLNGLKSNDPEQPGIIDGLNILANIEVDEEQIAELFALEQLFVSETTIRPIDEIILGFIEINSNLFNRHDKDMLSFYEIMDKLDLLVMILDMMPVLKEGDITSFLDEQNTPPYQVSFIVKIAGF